MITHKVRPVLVESKETNSQNLPLHTIGECIKQLSDVKIGELQLIQRNMFSFEYFKPMELLLISLEDEKIEVGNEFYSSKYETIDVLASNGVIDEFTSFKVIARQSQISPEYISKFIEQYNTDCVEDFEIKMMYKECPNSSIENWNYFPEPLLTNGFVSIVEKEYSHNLLSNMQYYMEYCQANGYVTPQDWLNKFKHYSDMKEPITYNEEEVNKLLHKFLDIQEGLNTYQRHASLDVWFEQNKKK